MNKEEKIALLKLAYLKKRAIDPELKQEVLTYFIQDFISLKTEQNESFLIQGEIINHMLYLYLLKEGLPIKPVNYKKILVKLGFEYYRSHGITYYKGLKLKDDIFKLYIINKNKSLADF